MTTVSPTDQSTINRFFMGRGLVQNWDALVNRLYGRTQSTFIREQKVIDDLRNAVLGHTPTANDYQYPQADIEKLRADILGRRDVDAVERELFDWAKRLHSAV